jgi:hypothetical protein
MWTKNCGRKIHRMKRIHRMIYERTYGSMRLLTCTGTTPHDEVGEIHLHLASLIARLLEGGEEKAIERERWGWGGGGGLERDRV